MHTLPQRSPRARKRQRQEGVVILVVLMMLLMATGTALYAMHSTSYEQRASSSFGEANWNRSQAECVTMAGLAIVEEQTPVRAQPLSTQWTDVGGMRSQLSQEFAMPTPLLGTSAGSAADLAISYDTEQDSPSFFGGNLPGGLSAFIGPDRRGVQPYPAPHPTIGNNVVSLPGSTPGVANGKLGQELKRTIITGFGVLLVNGENTPQTTDSSNVRGLHEVISMSRAYVDQVTVTN
jgi:hypothetical protein